MSARSGVAFGDALVAYSSATRRSPQQRLEGGGQIIERLSNRYRAIIGRARCPKSRGRARRPALLSLTRGQICWELSPKYRPLDSRPYQRGDMSASWSRSRDG